VDLREYLVAMAYETIQYSVSDHVAEITFDQPEKRNALSQALITDTTDALDRAADDDDVRVLFLTGEDPAFCAGGDLEEFQEMREQSPVNLLNEASSELLKRLAVYEMPIVAGVNGDAVGGGTGIVAACHLAYAAPDVNLGTVDIRIGMFPFGILPILRDRIGNGRALELALTGDLIAAKRAADIGLITDVVEDPVEKGRETARRIASFSPLSLGVGLRSFYETEGMPISKAIDAMSAYRVPIYKSRDLEEGASAFLEDREPDWTGR
jgi:enoyl-CoA hydratase/carnithine racemase